MDGMISHRHASVIEGGLEEHALLSTPVYLLPEGAFKELCTRQKRGGILTNSQLACSQPGEPEFHKYLSMKPFYKMKKHWKPDILF